MTNFYRIDLGDLSKYKQWIFPAGETHVRLNPETVDAVKKAESILVLARVNNAPDVIELALLLDAINACCKLETRIHLVLPYFPYARADRPFTEGDCFGKAVFLRFLCTFPIDSVTTLDIHSEESLAIQPELFASIHPEYFIEKAISEFAGATDSTGRKQLNVLFPDDGARSRYKLNDLIGSNTSATEIRILNAEKHRNPETGELTHFSVPPRSKFLDAPILIVDDICDGGGTFIGIADAMSGYELKLGLYVAHGVFSKGFTALLDKFDHIYTTNSLNVVHIPKDKVTVYDAIPELIKSVVSINQEVQPA